MPTIQDVFAAMEAADAAGDTTKVKNLGAFIQELQGGAPAAKPAGMLESGLAGAATGLAGIPLGIAHAGAKLTGIEDPYIQQKRKELEEWGKEHGTESFAGKVGTTIGGVLPYALAAPFTGGMSLAAELGLNAVTMGVPGAVDAYEAAKASGAGTAEAYEKAAAAGAMGTVAPKIVSGGSQAVGAALKAGEGALGKMGLAAGEGAVFSGAGTAANKAIELANDRQLDTPWLSPEDMAASALGFGAVRGVHHMAEAPGKRAAEKADNEALAARNATIVKEKAEREAQEALNAPTPFSELNKPTETDVAPARATQDQMRTMLAQAWEDRAAAISAASTAARSGDFEAAKTAQDEAVKHEARIRELHPLTEAAPEVPPPPREVPTEELQARLLQLQGTTNKKGNPVPGLYEKALRAGNHEGVTEHFAEMQDIQKQLKDRAAVESGNKTANTGPQLTDEATPYPRSDLTTPSELSQSPPRRTPADTARMVDAEAAEMQRAGARMQENVLAGRTEQRSLLEGAPLEQPKTVAGLQSDLAIARATGNRDATDRAIDAIRAMREGGSGEQADATSAAPTGTAALQGQMGSKLPSKVAQLAAVQDARNTAYGQLVSLVARFNRGAARQEEVDTAKQHVLDNLVAEINAHRTEPMDATQTQRVREEAANGLLRDLITRFGDTRSLYEKRNAKGEHVADISAQRKDGSWESPVNPDPRHWPGFKTIEGAAPGSQTFGSPYNAVLAIREGLDVLRNKNIDAKPGTAVERTYAPENTTPEALNTAIASAKPSPLLERVKDNQQVLSRREGAANDVAAWLHGQRVGRDVADLQARVEGHLRDIEEGKLTDDETAKVPMRNQPIQQSLLDHTSTYGDTSIAGEVGFKPQTVTDKEGTHAVPTDVEPITRGRIFNSASEFANYLGGEALRVTREMQGIAVKTIQRVIRSLAPEQQKIDQLTKNIEAEQAAYEAKTAEIKARNQAALKAAEKNAVGAAELVAQQQTAINQADAAHSIAQGWFAKVWERYLGELSTIKEAMGRAHDAITHTAKVRAEVAETLSRNLANVGALKDMARAQQALYMAMQRTVTHANYAKAREIQRTIEGLGKQLGLHPDQLSEPAKAFLKRDAALQRQFADELDTLTNQQRMFEMLQTSFDRTRPENLAGLQRDIEKAPPATEAMSRELEAARAAKRDADAAVATAEKKLHGTSPEGNFGARSPSSEFKPWDARTGRGGQEVGAEHEVHSPEITARIAAADTARQELEAKKREALAAVEAARDARLSRETGETQADREAADGRARAEHEAYLQRLAEMPSAKVSFEAMRTARESIDQERKAFLEERIANPETSESMRKADQTELNKITKAEAYLEKIGSPEAAVAKLALVREQNLLTKKTVPAAKAAVEAAAEGAARTAAMKKLNKAENRLKRVTALLDKNKASITEKNQTPAEKRAAATKYLADAHTQAIAEEGTTQGTPTVRDAQGKVIERGTALQPGDVSQLSRNEITAGDTRTNTPESMGKVTHTDAVTGKVTDVGPKTGTANPPVEQRRVTEVNRPVSKDEQKQANKEATAILSEREESELSRARTTEEVKNIRARVAGEQEMAQKESSTQREYVQTLREDVTRAERALDATKTDKWHGTEEQVAKRKVRVDDARDTLKRAETRLQRLEERAAGKDPEHTEALAHAAEREAALPPPEAAKPKAPKHTVAELEEMIAVAEEKADRAQTTVGLSGEQRDAYFKRVERLQAELKETKAAETTEPAAPAKKAATTTAPKTTVLEGTEFKSAAPERPWAHDDFAGERENTLYRTSIKTGETLDVPTLEKLAAETMAGWEKVPNTKVVQSETDLPLRIRGELVKAEKEGKVPGLYDPKTKTMFLIADNVHGAHDAVLTIVHEVAGHFGLREMLGGDYARTMQRLYEGNAALKEAVHAKMKDEPKLSKEAAVEEVLAEQAEQGSLADNKLSNALHRAYYAIKDWLHKTFGLTHVTDREVQQILANARRYVKKGKGGHEGVAQAGDTVYRTADLGPYANTPLGKMREVEEDKRGFFTRVNDGAGMALEHAIVDMHNYAVAALRKVGGHAAEQAEYALRDTGKSSTLMQSFFERGAPEIYKDKKGFVEIRASDKDSGGDVFTAAKDIPVKDTQAKFELATAYMTALRGKRLGADRVGKTRAEVDAVIDQVNADPKLKAALEKFRETYNKFNDPLVDMVVHSGAISKAEGIKWKEHGDYIPLYRKKDGKLEIQFGDQSYHTIGDIAHTPYIHMFKGSDAAILPINESIFHNVRLMTDVALTNIAKRNMGFVMQEAGAGAKKMFIHHGRGPQGKDVLTWKMEPNTTDKSKTITDAEGNVHLRIDTDGTLMDGIPVAMLAQSIEGYHATIPAYLNWAQTINNYLRAGITRMPTYTLRQLLKDPFSATLVTGMKKSPLSAVAGAFKEYGKAMTGDTADLGEVQRRGLVHNNLFTGDRDDCIALSKQMAGGDAPNAIRWFLNGLDKSAHNADAATRIQVYKDGLAQGLSEIQAANRTLESMNFHKRGASASIQHANRLLVFFNSGVQALNVSAKALQGKSLHEDTMHVRRKFINNAAMLTVMGALYSLQMNQDKEYSGLSMNDKIGNLHINTPLGMLKLPVGYFEGGGAAWAAGQAIAASIQDTAETKSIAKALGRYSMNAIPGGGGVPFFPGAKQGLEWAANKDLRTFQDIVPKGLQGLTPDQQFKDDTPELYKAIGSATNVSPEQMRHAINGLFGMAFDNAMQLADHYANGGKGIEKSAIPLHKTPFVSTLMQNPDSSEAKDEMYDEAIKAVSARDSLNHMKNSGRSGAEMRSYFKQHKIDIALAPMAQNFIKEMSTLNRTLTIIENQEGTAPAKAARKQELRTRQRELAERFNAARQRAERQLAA